MTKEVLFYRNRCVGYINNKQYFSQRSLEHFFYKFQGFGVSVGVLDILQSKGIEEVIILFDNKVLYTNVFNFISNGYEWTDEDNDKQLILPMNKFKEDTTKRFIEVQSSL